MLQDPPPPTHTHTHTFFPNFSFWFFNQLAFRYRYVPGVIFHHLNIRLFHFQNKTKSPNMCKTGLDLFSFVWNTRLNTETRQLTYFLYCIAKDPKTASSEISTIYHSVFVHHNQTACDCFSGRERPLLRSICT